MESMHLEFPLLDDTLANIVYWGSEEFDEYWIL